MSRINIEVSDKMSSKKSVLGSIENGMIRMSEHTRQALGLETGIFIRLNTKDGGELSLKVSIAYAEDVTDNGKNTAFVNKETYDKILFKKEHFVNVENGITLGCDPELFMIDAVSGNTISASHFFPFTGDVGSDCGLLELRPRPSTSEIELVHNIRNLLIKANNEINNKRVHDNTHPMLYAASSYKRACAGFHLHFGVPKAILSDHDTMTDTFRYRMAAVLDYYVGIPSIIPEGKEDSFRRSHRYEQYGKPGDFRYDNLTFEYRVPGGHMLRHPFLTTSLFIIGLTTMEDIVGRIRIATGNFKNAELIKDYNNMKLLYPSLPDRNEMYETITSTDIYKAVKHIDNIRRDLLSMIKYGEHIAKNDNIKSKLSIRKNYINRYFDCLENLDDTDMFTNNVNYNWRLGFSDELQKRQMGIHNTSIQTSSFNRGS